MRRAAFVLLLDAAILLLLSELLDGFVLDGAGSALGAAALIGLLNVAGLAGARPLRAAAHRADPRARRRCC